MYKIRGRY